jgi:hypothetical protein
MDIKIEEIKPGVALVLDPHELESAGATYTCDKIHRAEKQRHYVCAAVEEGMGRWLPLFSKDGPGRVKLPIAGRKGPASWPWRDLYYHPGQVWMMSHEAVIKAAEVAGDRSEPGDRCRIGDRFVPDLLGHKAAA